MPPTTRFAMRRTITPFPPRRGWAPLAGASFRLPGDTSPGCMPLVNTARAVYVPAAHVRTGSGNSMCGHDLSNQDAHVSIHEALETDQHPGLHSNLPLVVSSYPRFIGLDQRHHWGESPPGTTQTTHRIAACMQGITASDAALYCIHIPLHNQSCTGPPPPRNLHRSSPLHAAPVAGTVQCPPPERARPGYR